jgi:predicted nucleic acid-binding protein
MTLVVDASVAVKWVLPESGSEEAAALRRHDMDLIAPSLIIAEIGNALWKKVLRGQIEGRDALPALRTAIAHFSEIISFEDLVEAAIQLAIDVRQPIYDCLYLALAQREGVPLITADEDMLAAARRIKIKVRRI